MAYMLYNNRIDFVEFCVSTLSSHFGELEVPQSLGSKQTACELVNARTSYM